MRHSKEELDPTEASSSTALLPAGAHAMLELVLLIGAFLLTVRLAWAGTG